MAGKSALIVGATGQVGRHLLRELLESAQYTRVLEAGRRVTIPAPESTKLEQKVVDFEKPEELRAALSEGKWDVVFITLGTTQKAAGSPEKFEKIDREYVLNAAKAAKSDDPSHPQALLYCSAFGPDPKHSFIYPRSKGLTEQGLAEIGYSDTIIFRPGFLSGVERTDSRVLESLALGATKFIGLFHAGVQIDVSVLAKAMRIAGQVGSTALPFSAHGTKTNWGGNDFTAISNKGAGLLAKEKL
ncbi:NAD(P)-binding protein [Auriscalpium vulgare]|uniref:NAD(P)-binding protein n=1 Tax=Auriscalpium vulgare TaxID=40419 RepID=A0ACB8S4X2_9AGAM|nr:NAD(P)-binding protein [Auriscalpium vulgare]